MLSPLTLVRAVSLLLFFVLFLKEHWQLAHKQTLLPKLNGPPGFPLRRYSCIRTLSPRPFRWPLPLNESDTCTQRAMGHVTKSRSKGMENQCRESPFTSTGSLGMGGGVSRPASAPESQPAGLRLTFGCPLICSASLNQHCEAGDIQQTRLRGPKITRL